VVAEGSGLGRRACRQEMSIKGEEQRALVDEIVTRVAHEADTVKQPTSDKFGRDDHGIDDEGKLKP